MEFEIRKEYPPNIDEIRKVFDLGDRDVLFAWGITLYNPKGNAVPPHLMVHEKVHQMQQREVGVEKWWDRYLKDKDFRLNQEVEAYAYQYQFVKKEVNARTAKTFLFALASDLASPVYGNMIQYGRAESLIRNFRPSYAKDKSGEESKETSLSKE